MNYQSFSSSRIGTVIILAALCFSCSQKNDSLQEVSSESNQETAIPLSNEGKSEFEEPVDTNNGVKVAINANENLEWEKFKEKFHIASEGPEGFPDEVAVGPWTSWNDYEYRRVYRLENNNLWIQTFYKEKGTSNELDTNVIPKVLSLQESETTGLGSLWNDMIERGLFLTDSLSN